MYDSSIFLLDGENTVNLQSTLELKDYVNFGFLVFIFAKICVH